MSKRIRELVNGQPASGGRMSERWPYWIERRAGIDILVYRFGGCLPATRVEAWALRKLGRARKYKPKATDSQRGAA